MTYRDLGQRSDAFARYLLSKGIGKGVIVAFTMAEAPSKDYKSKARDIAGLDG